MNMKRTFFKIYFIFVNMLLLLCLFCILYEEVLCDYIYLKYLPNPVVYPVYDIGTGIVANVSEVTFWSVWDHVPWFGIFANNIANFTATFGILLYFVALILLIPVAIFNFSKTLWRYWLILLINLLIGCFLIGNVMPYYW